MGRFERSYSRSEQVQSEFVSPADAAKIRRRKRLEQNKKFRAMEEKYERRRKE